MTAQEQKKVAVVGAGKIGSTIAELLRDYYRVTVLDLIPPVAPVPGTEMVIVNAKDTEALSDKLRGNVAVINAAPHHLNGSISRAAHLALVSYLDLTEDVRSTNDVLEFWPWNVGACVPQCGLAPGFVSIVAADMAKKFETVDSVKLRVGALPQFPSNALGYNLTWSTDGLINEYCEPCEAIVDGRYCQVPAMAEREEFWLDGVRYEAFNTSGGVGSLCEHFNGEVRELNYRTIRYPGHAHMMRMLLNDLRLRDRRGVLADIMEHAVPTTDQDVVIIYVTVTGVRDGRLHQESYVNRVLPRYGKTAIQRTTASSICVVFDLLATGQLPTKGLIRQEDIPLSLFLENRFGGVFRC